MNHAEELIKNSTAEELLQSNFFYHRDCYKNATNKTDISRLKSRYEKSAHISSMPKRGRPSIEPDVLTNTAVISDSDATIERKSPRSQSILFKKNSCIICQQDGGKLHKVAYTSTGNNMLKVAQKLPDQSLFIKGTSPKNRKPTNTR